VYDVRVVAALSYTTQVQGVFPPVLSVLAAWRLMGAEMYEGMSNLQPPSPAIERGIALHKMIRAVNLTALTQLRLFLRPLPGARSQGVWPLLSSVMS
jgi:hypothetical protein